MVDFLVELVETAAQFRIVPGFLGNDLGEAGRKIRLYVRVQNSAIRPPCLVNR